MLDTMSVTSGGQRMFVEGQNKAGRLEGEEVIREVTLDHEDGRET